MTVTGRTIKVGHSDLCDVFLRQKYHCCIVLHSKTPHSNTTYPDTKWHSGVVLDLFLLDTILEVCNMIGGCDCFRCTNSAGEIPESCLKVTPSKSEWLIEVEIAMFISSLWGSKLLPNGNQTRQWKIYRLPPWKPPFIGDSATFDDTSAGSH
jgi:hypothetical protein